MHVAVAQIESALGDVHANLRKHLDVIEAARAAGTEVLLSGDHGKIERWRRDQGLLRTARRRPDLLAALDPASLSRRDVATLAGAGFEPPDPGMAK